MNEGAVSETVEVGVSGDKTLLRLKPGCDKALLDAEGARNIGEALARCSYEARFGVNTVPDGHSALTKVKVERAVTRVNNIIRSMTEQHKPRILIAQNVVDEVLKEFL